MAAPPPLGPPSVLQPQQSTLTIPETKVAFPTFHTVIREWIRLRRDVSNLANPIPWARDLGWSCVSLTAGFLLVLIPWVPAYNQLNSDGRATFAWVTPALGIGAIAAAVVATISFVMHARVEGVVHQDVKDVLEDMDQMHPPADAGQKT
jgi:hypothetical protein